MLGIKKIGQILIELNFISKDTLKDALAEQKKVKKLLGHILVGLQAITEEQLTRGLAQQAGMEFVDIEKMEISTDAVEKVVAETAEILNIMPIRYNEGLLTVAVSDPSNPHIESELKFALSSILQLKLVAASPSGILEARKRFYGQKDEDFISKEAGGDSLQQKQTTEISLEKLKADANAAPVIRLLNMILLDAVKARASDIHFEPYDKRFRVRYRVDGVLYEMNEPPPQLASAITSRIKVLSRLNIAERRLPQDGRIEITIENNPVDLRVSTLPTMYGEKVVMRVLDRSQVSLRLETLGFRPDELAAFRSLTAKPYGIILVTGPTGSGKTTTLYAAINEVNSEEDKIITIEDPVEYDIFGIVQVQINEDIGLTFASCLREILRQDPDTILVGEIRDLETASIAAEASLTGHIVFSTLHTSDAPSAYTRLLDLDLEPFLITATLEGVVAQRLVRKICTECKDEYEPTDKELAQLNLTRSEIGDRKFFYGRGCKSCRNSGYKGRTGIFEILKSSERIHNLVLGSASAAEIRKAAREEGMKTLREGGLCHIYDGITTVEEVVKETLASS